jgi:hypothetical protein
MRVIAGELLSQTFITQVRRRMFMMKALFLILASGRRRPGCGL